MQYVCTLFSLIRIFEFCTDSRSGLGCLVLTKKATGSCAWQTPVNIKQQYTTPRVKLIGHPHKHLLVLTWSGLFEGISWAKHNATEQLTALKYLHSKL